METITQFIESSLEQLSYAHITILMAIESSFIPFPSEVIVPPAGYLAAEGKLDLAFVIFFATLGSLLGAFINYGLALILGRPLLYKFSNSKIGHLCLLSQEKLEKAEQYFDKNGAVSTFVGRLIPGIRQLISIPAGLVRLSLPRFILYTTLGAGIWNGVLAFLGYILHKTINNISEIPEIAGRYGKYISAIIVISLLVTAVFYFIKRKRKQKDEEYIEREREQDQIENY